MECEHKWKEQGGHLTRCSECALYKYELSGAVGIAKTIANAVMLVQAELAHSETGSSEGRSSNAIQDYD